MYKIHTPVLDSASLMLPAVPGHRRPPLDFDSLAIDIQKTDGAGLFPPHLHKRDAQPVRPMLTDQ